MSGNSGTREAVAWSKTKPTTEGAYYVRGFNLFQLVQYEALVQVRTHHFDGESAPELVCNIHESTSNAGMDDWSPMIDMSEDFEWLGPLAAAPVAAAPDAVALRVAMETLEQIASTPRNKGARVSAMATLKFLQTQLAARPQGEEDRPPIDGCTESNCKRCRTHPNHRGDMEHAGIGWRPDSPQEASDAT
ncbi:MAG: hypothetical protein RSG92_15285 [Pseudomonas sp.]